MEDWVHEQPTSLANEAGKLNMSQVRYDSGKLVWYGYDDGTTRIYVPKGQRQALMTLHHEAIHHLAAAKTFGSINRHFYWPTARADVCKHYHACTFCEKSKATRNLTNGMARAVSSQPPRTRWGMDYYGVGDGEVLGLIDLDVIHVELTWHERQSAKLCKAAIRNNVLFRHGHFKELRSDHAREFMGRVLTQLKSDV